MIERGELLCLSQIMRERFLQIQRSPRFDNSLGVFGMQPGGRRHNHSVQVMLEQRAVTGKISSARRRFGISHAHQADEALLLQDSQVWEMDFPRDLPAAYYANPRRPHEIRNLCPERAGRHRIVNNPRPGRLEVHYCEFTLMRLARSGIASKRYAPPRQRLRSFALGEESVARLAGRGRRPGRRQSQRHDAPEWREAIE